MKTVELTKKEVDLIYWNIRTHKTTLENLLGNHKDIEICKDILLKLDDQ